MRNDFIYCNNKYEFKARVIFNFKDKKNVGTLFGIIKGKIYVTQGLRIIEINLSDFAKFMEIDLREAQAIVSKEVDTLEGARKLFAEQVEKHSSSVTEEIEEMKESLVEKVPGDLDINKVAGGARAKKERSIAYLIAKEKELESLKLERAEKTGEVIESALITGERLSELLETERKYKDLMSESSGQNDQNEEADFKEIEESED